jgi:NADH dehydrogenase [ubiquinone] 1 alpha subcomplex assembly factor 7
LVRVSSDAKKRARQREAVNALGRRIATLIETQGPLSVAQFMTIALHDRAEGYYAVRDPLGTSGDFVTAPEISQIFGELIGLWCVQVWREQGMPSPLQLVEFGPGRGTLMADALRAAKLAPEFLAHAEVVLVETNPVLRAEQAKRLGDYPLPIVWTERFESGRRPLFAIANEFFDALPVRQYVRTERGWCERMVVVDTDGELAFALAPVASAISIEGDQDAPLGAVHERAPAARAIAEDIGRTIAAEGGAALVIDYGYAKPGFGETLQAIGHHEFKDVLDAPGTIDLSAHVDFANLAASAAYGGARTYGPVGQGAFLQALGIAARAETLSRLNPDQAVSIADAVTRLTAPAQMGALFKALAILPPDAPRPPGF